MTPEQKAVLTDIRDSLVHLSTLTKDVPEPTRAILRTTIFLLTQKTKYLLEEE